MDCLAAKMRWNGCASELEPFADFVEEDSYWYMFYSLSSDHSHGIHLYVLDAGEPNIDLPVRLERSLYGYFRLLYMHLDRIESHYFVVDQHLVLSAVVEVVEAEGK